MWTVILYAWMPDDYAEFKRVTFRYKWVAMVYIGLEACLGTPKVRLEKK